MGEEIRIEGLEFYYAEGETKVLQEVNFTIPSQEFIAIIGPSGCGKTTLLKLIGGLINPIKGRVLIKNTLASQAKKEKIFGFVFQDPTLLPWRSVTDNIKLPQEITRCPTQDYEQLLRLVRLYEFKDKHPHQLSGGMKQRVAIARALSFGPKIMLMDEPFGALDDLTREYLNMELLRIWQNVKNTIIFVTHSIPEAVFLADKVVVLSKKPGTVKEIIDIKLPRPRNIDIKYTPEFNNIIKKLREHLDHEN